MYVQARGELFEFGPQIGSSPRTWRFAGEGPAVRGAGDGLLIETSTAAYVASPSGSLRPVIFRTDVPRLPLQQVVAFPDGFAVSDQNNRLFVFDRTATLVRTATVYGRWTVGRLLLHSYSATASRLVAFSIESGVEQWSLVIECEEGSELVTLRSDAAVLRCGDRLHAFDDRGVRRWSRLVGARGFALVPTAGEAVLGLVCREAFDCQLQSSDPMTGELRWSLDGAYAGTVARGGENSLLLVSVVSRAPLSSRLLFGMVGVDGRSGEVRWRTALSRSQMVLGTACFGDTLVPIAHERQLWTYDLAMHSRGPRVRLVY